MRRRTALRREVTPDPKFNDKTISRFMNMLMLDGKKWNAEKIVYGALDLALQKTQKTDALEVLTKAIDNVRPLLELKSRRVGGATYQIPVEVRGDRGVSLALRWIRNAARGRKGKPMQQRLADEILDAYNGQGTAVKKKEEIHKMAEANRAFSHYRW
ncbi:MAG: 30S ribosomal protein S7 [Candidatus Omnitrophica bacterium CG07_land_8_20_14_0_80_50_8]|nr:MAG: 30S ribosomal protein S7 [Candidatus Omnitrophica bacterium CG07_land_8_20_14_0_80_50_8]